MMSMPGFTADTSLYKATAHYGADKWAINSFTQMNRAIYLAAMGQDFPAHTCTCKGCGTGGGDVTGQCASVCKDKTVFSKGSEPHDYCNAAFVRPPVSFWHAAEGSRALFITL